MVDFEINYLILYSVWRVPIKTASLYIVSFIYLCLYLFIYLCMLIIDLLFTKLFLYIIFLDLLSIIRGGSRATATSNMDRFVIIVNGWKPLTIIAKHYILDVAAALDPPLMVFKLFACFAYSFAISFHLSIYVCDCSFIFVCLIIDLLFTKLFLYIIFLVLLSVRMVFKLFAHFAYSFAFFMHFLFPF